MIEKTRSSIPANHPVRMVFHQLTERGMSQRNVRDRDTIDYISNLLIDFINIENISRVKNQGVRRLEYTCDILEEASQAMSPSIRREYYRHLGDLTLFNLGLFPEQLTYGRRTVSPDYYAEQGRRSYTMAADIAGETSPSVVFRKLSLHFEQCVIGLNWVKLYINDPFYQYMLREFDVT